MTNKYQIVKIPVFDRIRCMSKDEFKNLDDKQFYQIFQNLLTES